MAQNTSDKCGGPAAKMDFRDYRQPVIVECRHCGEEYPLMRQRAKHHNSDCKQYKLLKAEESGY